MSVWVIKFISIWVTADIGVHVVHTSRVIITYTLESLFFPHIDNTIYRLQLTWRKKILRKKHKKVRAPIKLTCHWRQQLYISLQCLVMYSQSLLLRENKVAVDTNSLDSQNNRRRWFETPWRHCNDDTARLCRKYQQSFQYHDSLLHYTLCILLIEKRFTIFSSKFVRLSMAAFHH